MVFITFTKLARDYEWIFAYYVWGTSEVYAQLNALASSKSHSVSAFFSFYSRYKVHKGILVNKLVNSTYDETQPMFVCGYNAGQWEPLHVKVFQIVYNIV